MQQIINILFEKKEGHFANICPNKNNDKLLK